MKRLLLPFVLCLVLGLVGGTSGALLRLRFASPAAGTATGKKPATAIARKAASDSATARSTASPDSAVARRGADSTASRAALARVTPTTRDTTAAIGDAAPKVAARPAAPDSAALAAQRRLGRVLGAMPPKDAARVLEQLADGEAVAALATIREKQAALIMAHLPSDRAAAMVRAGLRLARGDR